MTPSVRACPALCLIAAALPAADAYILRPEEAWSYSWEERLAANADGESLPGFGRWTMPVHAGVWGAAWGTAHGSSEGRAQQVPGAAPLPRGASALVGAEIWAAWGPVYAHVRSDSLVTPERSQLPNPDPRQQWTGSDPTQGYGPAETVLRGSAGITGLGHTLAVSNENFRWGEGVFGGVLFGSGWRGFPHAVLATSHPMPLVPDWDGSPRLGYELVYGRMLAETGTAGSDVEIAACRVALRWSWLTMSASKALRFGGSDQPGMAWPEVVANFAPRRGNDASAGPGYPDPDRMQSLGLRADLPARVALSIEYGIDDQNGHVDNHGLPDTTLTQEARWTTAAWTMTADWLDIADDGRWRACVEWFRSESYFYGNGVYGPWAYQDELLGHGDGGNANSVRLLVQHHGQDDDRLTMVLGWRRLGWRNAQAGNPNTARGDSGTPGSDTFARIPWDRWSWDLRYEAPMDDRWSWSLELGAGYDRNRGFSATDDGLDGLAGLGLRRDW